MRTGIWAGICTSSYPRERILVIPTTQIYLPCLLTMKIFQISLLASFVSIPSINDV